MVVGISRSSTKLLFTCYDSETTPSSCGGSFLFIYTFKCMCTKIVTLCLQQICWQTLCAVAVIVRQRAGEARYWNTLFHRNSNDFTPSILVGFHDILEVWIRSRFFSAASLSYASLMFCRNCERIMQPPRKIIAILPYFKSQPYSSDAARI